MSVVQEVYVIRLHPRECPVAGFRHGGEIREKKEVAVAEGIPAEAVMIGLVHEDYGTGGMSGREEHLESPAAEVDDLPVLQIADLAVKAGCHFGKGGLVGPAYPYFIEIVAAAGMVGMDMRENHVVRLVRNRLHYPVESGDDGARIDEHGPVVALDNIEGLGRHHVAGPHPEVFVNLAENNVGPLIDQGIIEGKGVSAALNRLRRSAYCQQKAEYG